jgi:hypothetical protein
MSRSKKLNTNRPAKGAVIPYTDHLKKVIDFANSERTVRSGGVTETLSNIDIMVRKQFEAGLAGKTLAQRDYIDLVQRAEQARSGYINDQCERWTRIKEANQRIMDLAKAANAPIPRVLPHPDDILIDWANGVRVPGPIDEEDWMRFDQTVRIRDALFVQQAMEDCLNGVRLGDRPTLGGAGLLGYFFNETLPPSLRMSNFAWIDRVDKLSRLSQRDLLKRCRAAWWALGVRAARGKHFGSVEKLKPTLTAMYDLAKACLNQKSDPQGYEESLKDCAFAITEFRASASKVKGVGLRDAENEESAA